jgi:hypothetical protein
MDARRQTGEASTVLFLMVVAAMSFKAHFAAVILAASLLGCGSVLAQVAVGPPSLGPTSPLAMTPGMAVGPAGIPFGTTEMTTPGISPAPPAAMGALDCSNAGGPTSQVVSPLFDGGGTAGTASSACAGTAGAGASMPALPTLRAGRVGIPLGSTELGNAGLSPLPPVSTMLVSPIVPSVTTPLPTMDTAPATSAAPPCAVTGTFPDGSTTRQTRSAAGATGVPGC